VNTPEGKEWDEEFETIYDNWKKVIMKREKITFIRKGKQPLYL
jgi:hypothetical protein